MPRLSDTLDCLSERGDAAFAIDPADRIVYWNDACTKLVGHPVREVLGKRCHDFLAGRDVSGNPITALGRELNKHSRAAPELTAREAEILRCMAEGLGTAEIARRLSIAAVTVRNHTQSILQKLGVHTKLAAVVYAFRHKLIV